MNGPHGVPTLNPRISAQNCADSRLSRQPTMVWLNWMDRISPLIVTIPTPDRYSSAYGSIATNPTLTQRVPPCQAPGSVQRVGGEYRQSRPDQPESDPARGRHRLVPHQYTPRQLQCGSEVLQNSHGRQRHPRGGEGEQQQR